MFSSTTDVYTGLSQVSTTAFSDIKLYVVVIAGIVLAFYIVERLAQAIFPKAYYKESMNDKNDV